MIGGSLDSLILLFKAKIALFALIQRFSAVTFKLQFFAPIVKPRYLTVFTFSIRFPFTYILQLQSLFPRLKTIHLVLLEFIDSFRWLQKLDNLGLALLFNLKPCCLKKLTITH